MENSKFELAGLSLKSYASPNPPIHKEGLRVDTLGVRPVGELFQVQIPYVSCHIYVNQFSLDEACIVDFECHPITLARVAMSMSSGR